MCNALIGYKAEIAACGDGSGSAPRSRLEAADIDAVDVCDAVIILIILCHADACPFFRFGLTVDDEF